MKKLLSLLLSVLFLFPLAATVFAYDYSGNKKEFLMIDDADIISDNNEKYINERLEEISNKYKCEIAILTVKTSGENDILFFAENYYTNNQYGYGSTNDGIILVVDIKKRETAVYPHGNAADIFNNKACKDLENDFIPYLTNNDYKQAFTEFYEGCETLLDNSQTSEGILSEIFSLKWIFIAIFIGVAVGFIYTHYLKAQLKTVKPQSSAADYMVTGSLQMTQQKDIFMYSNIKKTPRPKNNSSSGKGVSGGSQGTKSRF